MNILLIGSLLVATSISPDPPKVDINESYEAIILVNGAPMAATISDKAEVIDLIGPAHDYFESTLSESSIIKSAKKSAANRDQIIVGKKIRLIDTSAWSEFSYEDISELRELAVSMESSTELSSIMILRTPETIDLSDRTKNTLLGFGVKEERIKTVVLPNATEDNIVIVGIEKTST